MLVLNGNSYTGGQRTTQLVTCHPIVRTIQRVDLLRPNMRYTLHSQWMPLIFADSLQYLA